MKMMETQRAEYLERITGFSVCTNPDHNSSWQKCGVMLNVNTKCQACHNRIFHGANSSYIVNNLVEVNNVRPRGIRRAAVSSPLLPEACPPRQTSHLPAL